MAFDIKTEWKKRPWWLNLILLFCIYMTFIYSPFDVVFKPVAEDEDVWVGLMLTGWAAKVGGVVHWIVYGALGWGLWFMRPWAWWLGSLYATQVALAMFAFPLLQSQSMGGLTGGIIAGLVFAIPAMAFWRSRSLFESTPAAVEPAP